MADNWISLDRRKMSKSPCTTILSFGPQVSFRRIHLFFEHSTYRWSCFTLEGTSRSYTSPVSHPLSSCYFIWHHRLLLRRKPNNRRTFIWHCQCCEAVQCLPYSRTILKRTRQNQVLQQSNESPSCRQSLRVTCANTSTNHRRSYARTYVGKMCTKLHSRRNHVHWRSLHGYLVSTTVRQIFTLHTSVQSFFSWGWVHCRQWQQGGNREYISLSILVSFIFFFCGQSYWTADSSGGPCGARPVTAIQYQRSYRLAQYF
mmetsp:Transcript_26089/g.37428  ORF Transcript_26089/g.37428 Transcript_26089/m.37428 type:complete len:258 (-) Transcript_26089:26-799(-)